jgi:hypothetical protein
MARAQAWTSFSQFIPFRHNGREKVVYGNLWQPHFRFDGGIQAV